MNKNMFQSENSEYATNSHVCDFDAEFGIKTPASETNQISRIIKQVKRDKQKKKDDELWDEHCEQQNIVVSITGSYVVKDNNYPSILLPKNTSHDSLFQSGAITIISNENLQDDVSYTNSSYHSYTENSSLKPIHENDQENQNDVDEDFILELNEANVQNSRNASTDDVQNNKDNGTSHDESNLEIKHFLTSREIAISTKLWLLRSKINTALDAIVELWEFEPILDGEEDLARRHKRASEFESRFSRHYLYNLSRQMSEIHKLMKNYSPRFVEKNSSQNIFQKISNAHTIIFQGLSAYQKHLASSIPGGVPEKLNDLLVHACDLWRICNKCEILKPILYSPSRNEVYIEDIDEKCKKLLQNIRIDQENKMKLEQKPSCTTITVTPKKSPKKIDKKNRLSMYTLETPYILKNQRAFWKRSLNHLSKPKNIKPKKKISNSEHKLSNKMELTVNYLNPSMSQESFPMKQKKSEILCEPPKEDEIITQMDILNQRESGINNSTEAIKKNESNLDGGMSKEQFNESLRPLLLEILQNIDNKENLNDEKTSMMELKNVLTEIKQVTVADHNKSETDITEKLSLQKKRSKTTITGVKNAKLICLSPVESENDEDINSIVSTQPPCQTVATSTSDVEIKTPKKCIDSPTQTLSLTINATKNNTNNTWKNPSPRSKFESPRKDIAKTVKFQKSYPKTMKINMPKSIIRNLNKYKDLYGNYTRKNSMYVIKKNRKPWEIVSKISDNLLDNMISDVVSELEIDNLLLKLYEMEFH